MLTAPTDVRVFSAAAALFISSAAAAQVSIHSIDPPSGSAAAYAYAISDDGSTVVGYYEHPTGRKAFRWTFGAGIEALWPGEAYAVSANGSVTVGIIDSFSQGPSPYISSVGFTGMRQSSLPSDISGDGRTVVGSGPAYVCTVNSPSRAFYWMQSDFQQVWLATLQSNWCPGTASATAVSSDGSTIVGESTTDSGYTRAFRRRDSLTDLGAIDGTVSHASDVNHDGSVVVGWSGAGTHQHAFLWSASAGMQDIGSVEETWNSSALGISSQAMVVVGTSGGRASVWKPGMGMVSLEAFLTAQGLNLAGWELVEAQRVSADGTNILGFGRYNGANRYWVVRGVLPCDPTGSRDVNANGIADSCEADCNENSIPDSYEVTEGLTSDCDRNGVPDSCDLVAGAPDCNRNSVLDSCDIASGAASDYDSNGVPDSCQCLADLFVDHQVNGADLGILLSQWGAGGGAVADINRDGHVNGADLGILLSSWGACP